ncbi:glutaredoxin family protein [Brevibacterium oceani]|uniref:glutaredoxin family protein n=1 Tax=Brevibacterium oceani TaxID=358099 RepID=UPI0015E70DDB
MIKVYSKPVCGQCVGVKLWLNKNEIEFEELCIMDSLDLMAEHGVQSAPAVFKGDELISVGFNPEELEILL